MSKYVYSTLTASQVYSDKKGGKVRINGGANSPTKHMLTPRGIATQVTDDEVKILEASKLFQNHKSKGFVEVSTFKKDPDRVSGNLTPADNSAPDTKEKLAQQGKQAPKPAEKK